MRGIISNGINSCASLYPVTSPDRQLFAGAFGKFLATIFPEIKTRIEKPLVLAAGRTRVGWQPCIDRDSARAAILSILTARRVCSVELHISRIRPGFFRLKMARAHKIRAFICGNICTDLLFSGEGANTCIYGRALEPSINRARKVKIQICRRRRAKYINIRLRPYAFVARSAYSRIFESEYIHISSMFEVWWENFAAWIFRVL